MNFTVANVVKRIYHIIREECGTLKLSLKDHLVLSKVPLDGMRMDSLKVIASRGSLQLRESEQLDNIDEDAAEEDEQQPLSGSSSKRQSAVNLRHITSGT